MCFCIRVVCVCDCDHDDFFDAFKLQNCGHVFFIFQFESEFVVVIFGTGSEADYGGKLAS